MKIISPIFLSFILIVSSFAQENNLTLELVTVDEYKITPEKLKQIQFIPDVNSFSYVKDDTLFAETVDGDKITLITLNSFNDEISKHNLAAASSIPQIKWESEYNFHFWNKKKLLVYNVEEQSLIQANELPAEAGNIDLSENNIAAYTIDNNLFISNNGSQAQVTDEENKGIVSGQPVHRNEFGINKGTFWSPKENYLAFYRMDESMVTDYPIIDISQRPAELKMIKYPMAGMKSHHVTVGVYNLNSGSTIYLNTGEPKEQYIASLSWSPDEKNIYLAQLNRDQNHLWMIKYDIESGNAVDTLFEESSAKYVEPEHGLIFIDNENFLWLSERDGWNHLYLYKTSGELIKQLTEGEWEITDFDGLDKSGSKAFFYATKESPIERHYYFADIESGELTKITNGAGIHNVKRDNGGKYFIDYFNSLGFPNRTVLLDEYKDHRILVNADNPLIEFNFVETRIFTLVKNGYELYCKMYFPPDFDSTKKYPSITYLYGGPHAQVVVNRWPLGRELWFNYMAENGYIIFLMDNRGSAYRGLEFEQAIFRNLGKVEIEDQVFGAEYLKSLPYIDEERMGIHGWSYGGFMAVSMMLRTPGLYKAGIAGGPVIDWSYYEVMYTERYMDTPETNPEGYKESSLLNYVNDLEGNLLLVHGTEDDIVVWQHSLLLMERAAHLNKAIDYLPYVGHGHGVGGTDKLHLYRTMTDYFNKHLK